MEDSLGRDTLDTCESLDSLRGEFESNREWRLRGKFLEMNYGSLQLDRLVCLSRCFINIAIYGCSYPAAVMKEIHERSQGILEEVKAEKKVEAKQKYASSFVKASSGLATSSSINFPGANTADMKKLLPSVQTADTRASRWAGNQGCSKVIHSELKTNNNSVAPATSMVPRDYGYWGGQEGVTGSFEEGIDKSTVPVTHSNRDLWSQGTHFDNPEPYSQHPKTALSIEECLMACQRETNPVLQKIRQLAFEVLRLQSKLVQNSKEVLHSAGNRVPVLIDFAVEQVVNKRAVNFLCRVLVQGVEVASEMGTSIKQAKTNACETALKIIMMPRLEIIQTGGKNPVLKGTGLMQDRNICQIPPDQYDTNNASSNRKPSYNRKSPGMAIPYGKETNITRVKRKRQCKALEEFIIVEQWNPSSVGGPVNMLKQCSQFNKVRLEYDFFTQGMATRCVVKIEGEVVADVLDSTKATAKTTASARCLSNLRTCCWVLKTKQAVDSTTSISKEEIQQEIQQKSSQISSDNIGRKMLQKMGWSGGGVGKDGTGISEPVSLVSVINRQGLGLSSESGISDDFRQRMKEIIENYVTSESQEDLAFSSEFSIEERKIIHDICRKLNLRSVSRGKGQNRYLCVSRKRSANQLFEHVMACGGETVKYKLLPPGTDDSNEDNQLGYCDDFVE